MARRRTRSSRRSRRSRLGVPDFLMLMGIHTGVVYLLLTWLGVPEGAAVVVSLISLGFILGIAAFAALLLGLISLVPQLPRLRSPIVVQIRRDGNAKPSDQ